VDFLVTVDNQPWFCVEVKENNTNISTQLHYFNEKQNIPFAYQDKKTRRGQSHKKIRLVSADAFLSELI